MKTKQLLSVFLFSLMMAFSSAAAAFTAVMSGPYSDPATWGGIAPDDSVLAQDIIIPAGIDVTLDVHVTFIGGANSIQVDGTLNGGTHGLWLVQGALNGAGTVDIAWISAGSLATMGFTGALTVDKLNLMGATLNVAGPATVEDTLNLDSGTLTLVTGGILTPVAGTAIRVNSGALAVSGGTLNAVAAYDLHYVGSSVNAGPEASGTGLNNLTINLAAPTAMVTMTGNVDAAGAVSIIKGRLALNGNMLTVGGTYNQAPTAYLFGSNSSTLHMNMNASIGDTIYFEPGNSILKDLIVDLASTGTIWLGSHLQIANQVNLIKGKVDCAAKNLIMLPGSMIAGYSNVNYILTTGAGKLHMNVTSAAPHTVFPVGTPNGYSPASIQQTALGSTGTFMVGVINDVYSNGFSGTSLAASNSMVARTWFIDAASTVTVNMNLKLGWMTSAEVNAFNRNSSYISHYTAGAWDSTMAMAAVAGPFATYEASRNSVTSLNTSGFAVMDKTPVGIEEVNGLSFALYPNPATEVITAEFNRLNGTALFEVVDVTGKVIMKETSAELRHRLDVESLNKGIYFLRITVGGETSVRRFIRS